MALEGLGGGGGVGGGVGGDRADDERVATRGGAPGEGGAAGHGGPARAGDGKSGGGRGATQAARAVAHTCGWSSSWSWYDGAVEAMRDACVARSSTAACARSRDGWSVQGRSQTCLTRRRAGLILATRRFGASHLTLRALPTWPPCPSSPPLPPAPSWPLSRVARWSPPMSAPSAASARTCPRTSTARMEAKKKLIAQNKCVSRARHLGPLRLDPPPERALTPFHRRSRSQG